jgi:enoyl-CoA hydratase/carnithine racemase
MPQRRRQRPAAGKNPKRITIPKFLVPIAPEYREIAACTKPTIGMINGLAYGGAAVLASSVDMRVGCEDSRFRFLAAAYGRINSTWTLPDGYSW